LTIIVIISGFSPARAKFALKMARPRSRRCPSGFDKLAEKAKPEVLLGFLNKIFTHMDAAYTENGVTKCVTKRHVYKC